MSGHISRAEHEAALDAVRVELRAAADRNVELHEALQAARDDRDHAANRLGLTDTVIDRQRAEIETLRERIAEHQRAMTCLLQVTGGAIGYGDDIQWVLTR